MKQCAPGLVLETHLHPRFREWLTREARAQDIMGRDMLFIYAYIPIYVSSHGGKIKPVVISQLFVDLRCKDALVAKAGECVMKAAQASKKINKPHLEITVNLTKLCGMEHFHV